MCRRAAGEICDGGGRSRVEPAVCRSSCSFTPPTSSRSGLPSPAGVPSSISSPCSRQGKPASDVCVCGIGSVAELGRGARRAIEHDARWVARAVRIPGEVGGPAAAELAAHTAAFDTCEKPVQRIHRLSDLTRQPLHRQAGPTHRHRPGCGAARTTPADAPSTTRRETAAGGGATLGDAVTASASGATATPDAEPELARASKLFGRAAATPLPGVRRHARRSARVECPP
jgi:hypothetical protein